MSARSIPENLSTGKPTQKDEGSIPEAELDDFLLHANLDCAHWGQGIWFKIDHRGSLEQAPRVAYVSWTWGEWEKTVFRMVKRLPTTLTTSGLSPYTPCLLIKILRAGEGNLSSNGFPSCVSGLELEKGPLPCLYLIRCGKPVHRVISRSNLLIPEEFIDFEYRNKKYADKMNRIGLSVAEVSSAREVIEKAGESEGNRITQDTDLRELITVPFSELMVRDDRDQQDAVDAFLSAHANKSKPLTWSNNLEISAEGDYVVTLATLQQTLAKQKEGLPGNALENEGGGRWVWRSGR